MQISQENWIVTGVVLLSIILTALVFITQIILSTRKTSKRNSDEIKELKSVSEAQERREKERLESLSDKIFLTVSTNEEKTEERLTNIENSINATNTSIENLQKYIIDLYRHCVQM